MTCSKCGHNWHEHSGYNQGWCRGRSKRGEECLCVSFTEVAK